MCAKSSIFIVVLISERLPKDSNAVSVGAKMVKGPFPSSTDTKSAWIKAATNVSCTPLPAAFVGIFSDLSADTLRGIVEIIKQATTKQISFCLMNLMGKVPNINQCKFPYIRMVNDIR